MPITSGQISSFKRPHGSFGRLIRKPAASGYNPGVNGVQPLTLYFPAMPESIDLDRSADYFIENNIIFPDGFHVYTKTNPLPIPISFKLHAMDPVYCAKNGAMTLLQVAAFLHSALLPVPQTSQSGVAQQYATASPVAAQSTGAPAPVLNDQTSTQIGAATVDQTQQVFSSTFASSFYGPPAFQLQVIFAGNGNPGINATGYIKDVRVKLKEPWLQGRNGAFNLPTSADYEFTFMHVPGYTDIYSNDKSTTTSAANILVQAYSDTVLNQLFNTQGLTTAANGQGQTTKLINTTNDGSGNSGIA